MTTIVKLDVVGDIHGHLEALRALGHSLEYDVDGDWSHPEGRMLVFVGDLVDRGPSSLEVAELVMRLVAARRAVCLMGNHEYNLVRWHHGASKPKHSNRSTIVDIESRRDRWVPVIDWFAQLPLAIELPALRIIHAVWHLGCVESVAPALRVPRAAEVAQDDHADLLNHVVLASPFVGQGLNEGLSTARWPGNEDSAHEILIKGYELPAPAKFTDSDGKERDVVRAVWWNDPDAPVPRDRITVFGHYWNVPPTDSEQPVAPPFASGHPELARWQKERSERTSDRGVLDLAHGAQLVCVDYNGVFNAGGGSCVGAYRWPEHQVAWARGARSALVE